MSREEDIPLMAVIFAAQQNDLELMRTLKNKGVTMRIIVKENDCTILHVAAYYGHESIVSWLLEENSIEVDVKDHLGRTPLILAVESGYMAVANILLKKYADINHCDKKIIHHLPHITIKLKWLSKRKNA